MAILLGILAGIVVVLGAAFGLLVVRFRRNQYRASQVWHTRSLELHPLDLDPVERLTITPLVEARTAGGELRVALSPHDSCDWALGAFQEAWGSDFEVVAVGRPIEFSANGRQEDN